MVGGQAEVDGVMMKESKKISMSVRLPDGKIENECWDSVDQNKWYLKIPIIRGGVNFGFM